MTVGLLGTGYLGLVHGVGLANFGMKVICTDIDIQKVELLNEGQLPFFEPELASNMRMAMDAGLLIFSNDIKLMIESSPIIFITVGTPTTDEGEADLSNVIEAALMIATYMNEDKAVVIKSTVPVGSTRHIERRIAKELADRKVSTRVEIISNPEFLSEGSAVKDMNHPNRIVIGTQSEYGKKIMNTIYHKYKEKRVPFIYTDLETAELIKYASNAFLATKISFINEFALLAEKTGANIVDISKAMGLDKRIGSAYLQPGAGYGGSCFPKDTAAILNLSNHYGEPLYVVKAAIEANEKQKNRMVEKIANSLAQNGSLKGVKIAILGLSFKPNTDDIREAPSIHIIRRLLDKGAHIQAYCPGGSVKTKQVFKSDEAQIKYYEDEYQCVIAADAVVILTEWSQFYRLNLDRIQTSMKGNLWFDLRNQFVNHKTIRKQFNYQPVGLN
ncbi:UDP-glucose/GDP-mannose dehydrogenase family protein [Paenibacillus psychroresistens]|uniref:UDP-glucose 6-dehydrogenase n=2 Tax=Paenibacillus psychroresistens TaxID=1778678 RepID=A0A6B8RW40_9BACL|nr:UDP-glucose/GDP-mannose dehydrogenase family protein [Paenibacillus psychroresistens]